MIEWLKTNIDNIEAGNLQLPEQIHSEIPSFSGKKIRCLLNKLASGENYLEIGVYKGGTYIAAHYNNLVNYSVAIDNFSEFGGEKNIFLNNCKRFNVEPNLINEDCFEVDIKQILEPITVYFYDGPHMYHNHYHAISHYYAALNDRFILVVDDYNWEPVNTATRQAIEDLNIKVLYDRWLGHGKKEDAAGWWNGLYVALCQKTEK